jgi:predicted ester cyclase
MMLKNASWGMTNMSVEEKKALVRREIEEAWHKGNLMVVDEIYAANFIDHSPFPGTTPDREGIKQFIKIIRDAFPDIKLTIEDLISESDKVVERVTATGTNKGEFMGTTPTGKQITVPIITINRFTGDKIVERWSISDQLAMMRQLGVIPPH